MHNEVLHMDMGGPLRVMVNGEGKWMMEAWEWKW
uniref:Uncharacterized protein n=1 Tax=Vitis vinifera TaxID=29760 RepID=F6I1E2_VITVI